MAILSTGCMGQLPQALPPRHPEKGHLWRGEADRTLGRIRHVLNVLCRELAPMSGQSDGRDGRQPKRYRRGKAEACSGSLGQEANTTSKGRMRHVVVDRPSLLMPAILDVTDIQDRHDPVLPRGAWSGLYPVLLKLCAGGGDQGATIQAGLRPTCRLTNFEIVRLPTQDTVERGIATQPLPTNGQASGEPDRPGLATLPWASLRRGLRCLCPEYPVIIDGPFVSGFIRGPP